MIQQRINDLKSGELAGEKRGEKRGENFDDLLEGLRVVLDGVPEFTIDGDELLGPAAYARSVSHN